MSSGITPGIRQRWLDPKGQLLVVNILDRLAAGASLVDLPLGRVAGRLDLRALPAPRPIAVTPPETVRLRTADGIELNYQLANVIGQMQLAGVELRDLDLSAATLPHVKLRHTSVENCLFDDAVIGELILSASSIRDCSFRNARLQAAFGIAVDGTHNHIERTDFSDADLSESSCGTASFVDCDFSRAKLENVNFWQADLIRCRFAGVLKSVIFDGRVLEPAEKSTGNPMEDIDMTAVTAFEGGAFRGINFDRVHLPADPNLVVIRNPHSWVPQSLAKLGDRDDLAARIVRGSLKQKEKMDLRPDAGGHSFVNLGRIEDIDARQLMAELIAEFAK